MQAKGEGMQIQRRAITAWAKVQGHRIIAWCEDEGVSGTTEALSRPGLLCAMGRLQDDAQGVVVWRLDRLARDVIVQEAFLRDLHRQGRQLFSTVDSEQAVLGDDAADPGRKMVRTMLGAVATYEKEMAVLRMTAGRVAKANKGGWASFGRVPYGYRSDNARLVPVPEEQAVIARMRELRSEGLSLRAIAEALEAEGHQPKRGAAWHPTSLARILEREELVK